jgi:hypothetical protein
MTYSLLVLAQNYQLLTFGMSLRAPDIITSSSQASHVNVTTIALGTKPVTPEELIGEPFTAPKVVLPADSNQQTVLNTLSETTEKLFYQISLLSESKKKMKER